MKEAEIVVSNCLIGALDPPTNTEGVVRSVMVMEKGDEKDGGFFASTVGVDCRPYAVIVHAGEDFVVRSIKTGGRQGRQLVPPFEPATFVLQLSKLIQALPT